MSDGLEIAIAPSLARLGFRGWRLQKTRRTSVEYIVPPLCQVPGGAFLMGSAENDPVAQPGEKPCEWVQVEAFAIARYPVTVAEYTCYLKAHPKLAVPGSALLPKYARIAPAWQGTTLNWAVQQTLPDHPVVCVSWRQANRYATWLATITGQNWRLPTEDEWEKAARWDEASQHARVYPWGDSWESERANTQEGRPKMTTPVGSYPSGASPYGVEDMTGNVMQWCRNTWRTPATKQDVWPSLLSSLQVVRGGSWGSNARDSRTAGRITSRPGDHNAYLGFRLVLS
jgi:formylglycine-generating enzyme required for sulfatase activity